MIFGFLSSRRQERSILLMRFSQADFQFSPQTHRDENINRPFCYMLPHLQTDIIAWFNETIQNVMQFVVSRDTIKQ
jgi:hypothetical protein